MEVVGVWMHSLSPSIRLCDPVVISIALLFEGGGSEKENWATKACVYYLLSEIHSERFTQRDPLRLCRFAFLLPGGAGGCLVVMRQAKTCQDTGYSARSEPLRNRRSPVC